MNPLRLRSVRRVGRSIRPLAGLVVAGCVFGLATRALPAQAPGAAAPSDPFARYLTPGQCEQAAIRLNQLYWRNKRPDTVMYAPLTDSVPATVIASARACAARFTVAKVPERELLNLAQLYTWAKQDDLAQAAIDRLLAAEAKQPVLDRGWTLQLLATSLLDAQPTRLTAARKYLAQLDALGGPVATWRLFAHAAFSRHAITVDDRTTATAEGRAALAAASAMSHDDRIDFVFSILGAYEALAEPLAVQQGGPAALALFDTANTDLFPLRPAGTRDLAVLQSAANNARAPYTLFGTKGDTLMATRWYNKSDTTVRPWPGKVSILYFASSACGGRCYPTYATIRRLQAKYAAQGLDVVFMASTYGYFRNHPMPDAVAERDSVGSYFINFLKFPVAMAVEERHFTRLDDGRLTAERTANSRAYSRGRNGILIDKHGVVQLVDSLQPNREMLWNAEIQAALQAAP